MQATTQTSPFYRKLSNALMTDGGYSRATAGAFVRQVSGLAALSPTLTNDISGLGADRRLKVTISKNGASFYESRKRQLTLALPPSPTYPSVTEEYRGGPNPVPVASGRISPAGIFVGNLAHEFGRMHDRNLPAALRLDRTDLKNEGVFAGMLLLSEGKATAHATKVAREVAFNSRGEKATQIPLGPPTQARSDLLLKHISAPTSPSAVGDNASMFAGLIPSATGGSYLSAYLGMWHGARDPTIDGRNFATVDSVKIAETPQGALRSFTIAGTDAAAHKNIATWTEKDGKATRSIVGQNLATTPVPTGSKAHGHGPADNRPVPPEPATTANRPNPHSVPEPRPVWVRPVGSLPDYGILSRWAALPNPLDPVVHNATGASRGPSSQIGGSSDSGPGR